MLVPCFLLFILILTLPAYIVHLQRCTYTDPYFRPLKFYILFTTESASAHAQNTFAHFSISSAAHGNKGPCVGVSSQHNMTSLSCWIALLLSTASTVHLNLFWEGSNSTALQILPSSRQSTQRINGELEEI